MYAGKSLKPKEVEYSDRIKEKLKEISKDVTYNSKLPVKMLITYEEDGNGEAIDGTQKYEICEIMGNLIQGGEQSNLFAKRLSDQP